MINQDRIHLALAEDNEIMRNGLALILESFPSLNLLHTAVNGQDLLKQIEETKTLPDVILLDIDMPKLNGFDTCIEIRKRYKEVGVIFLTSHISNQFIQHAVKVGGHGYLSKNSDVDEILEAINEVREKGYYYNDLFHIDLVKDLLSKGNVKQDFPKVVDLTPREIDFLRLLCKEMTDAEIANELNISPLSAETYRKNLLKKVGVKKAIGLAIYAVKHNLL